MKHLQTYKERIVENNAFNNGDEVLIVYKLPGTEKSELIPVRIIEREAGSNMYLVSFVVDGNPYQNHDDMSVEFGKIMGPYEPVKEPISPTLQGSQPVPTDYSKASAISSGGQSNDYVLPNS